MDLQKWDGHTHGPYCKHGSSAAFDAYLTRAIELGFTRYSVTEHPPLPDRFTANPEVMKQLAMKEEELPHYFRNAWEVKSRFSERIDVRVGLELDYLYHHEQFTERLLTEYQDQIEDAIISVHFLPGKQGMHCVDWDVQEIDRQLIRYYGSFERLIEVYFEHVHLALEQARLFRIPVRLGHATLFQKFKTALPECDELVITSHLLNVFEILKDDGIGLDVNTACLDLETCADVYPPLSLASIAKEMGVACVFGSDAHQPRHVGRHWDAVQKILG